MLEKPQPASGFRSDINGLRAWAVLAVVFYHFGVRGVGGGFAGVDIFFVISGALMTGIVVRGLERGRFSVMSFYTARARRIVPALAALCAVLLLLGWWVLPPLDYQLLAWQAIDSLAFLSNVQYWREANYFDAASHEKWLLHTWSLAVEWQFYLLLPLFIVAVWKVRPGKRPLMVVMWLCCLASLALCVLLTPMKPTGSFFMLPTRAWEMLAGGLVCLLAPRFKPTAGASMLVELVGLACIVGAVVVYDTNSPWPGWRALLPVGGSVLVLWAARAHSPWTSNPVLQWLGTCSYSLYLWHWPVVVAMAYFQLPATPSLVVVGLILSFTLGQLSYRWIENPARRYLLGAAKGSAPVLLGITCAIAGFGAMVVLEAGYTGRVSAEVLLTSNEALNMNARRATCHPGTGVASPSCMFGGRQLGAILLGDSHANALVSALALAAKQPDVGVMEWSYSACPILLGAHPVRASQNQCAEFVDWAVQQLSAVPKDVPVVIVNRHAQYAMGHNEVPGQDGIPLVYFSKPFETPAPAFMQEYAQHLTQTACRLAREHPVYLVRPIPEMGINVPHTARFLIFGRRDDTSISLATYHQRNHAFWKAQDAARDQCGVKILDPLPYLCWDQRCHGLLGGRPLYYDDNHLSEFGNTLLIPMFAQVFHPH